MQQISRSTPGAPGRIAVLHRPHHIQPAVPGGHIIHPWRLSALPGLGGGLALDGPGGGARRVVGPWERLKKRGAANAITGPSRVEGDESPLGFHFPVKEISAHDEVDGQMRTLV